MEHNLKIWPPFFDRVVFGQKPWELRKNDRDFQVNDTLVLREWLPETKEFTGRRVECLVTYVLSGPAFGLPEGYCIMSLTVQILHP